MGLLGTLTHIAFATQLLQQSGQPRGALETLASLTHRRNRPSCHVPEATKGCTEAIGRGNR